MSGPEGLDGAAPDAVRPGPGDRVYGPGDFDRDGQGAGDQGDTGRRDPRVVILTRDELHAKRLRLEARISEIVRIQADMKDLMDELDDVLWLLGDADG